MHEIMGVQREHLLFERKVFDIAVCMQMYVYMYIYGPSLYVGCINYQGSGSSGVLIIPTLLFTP